MRQHRELWKLGADVELVNLPDFAEVLGQRLLAGVSPSPVLLQVQPTTERQEMSFCSEGKQP